MKKLKLKLNSWWLLIILSLLSLNSCSSVPDTIICAEVNLSKGVCTYTVSGKNIVIDDENLFEGSTWFDLRMKSLVVPATSWAKIKAFLLKMCKQNKCSVDISSWDRNLDSNTP